MRGSSASAFPFREIRYIHTSSSLYRGMYCKCLQTSHQSSTSSSLGLASGLPSRLCDPSLRGPSLQKARPPASFGMTAGYPSYMLLQYELPNSCASFVFLARSRVLTKTQSEHKTARIATCRGVMPSGLNEDYMYTYNRDTCAYTHIYIYVCIHVCMCFCICI